MAGRCEAFSTFLLSAYKRQNAKSPKYPPHSLYFQPAGGRSSISQEAIGWPIVCATLQKGAGRIQLVDFRLVDLLRDLGGSWKLRAVPAATQSLDQLDRSGHGLGAEGSESLLVREQGGLRDQNVEVG